MVLVFLAVSFFCGISGGIFSVFLVFLQYRYGTETTVSHVSNTEYRYCIKIGYTAMHWKGRRPKWKIVWPSERRRPDAPS